MQQTTEEREIAAKNLREKTIKDTEREAQKQRFALFSQPMSLCIGDDSLNKNHIPLRDEATGKPITQPRNVQVSHLQKGQVKSSYFQQLGFTTIGDLYIDVERRRNKDALQEKSKVKAEQVFKPASFQKVLLGSSYKHETDFNIKEKNYRDSEGKVITAPSNVLTNIDSKINTKFFKFREHKPDQYDRAQELKKKERLDHVQKMGEQPNFKTTVYGQRPFTSDKRTFGEDKPLSKKNAPETKLNIVQHEQAFKPSNPPKSSHQGYLNKFPKYMEDPLRIPKRINHEKKDIFKPNHGGHLSRPTTTVSCHPVNIRRELSAGIHRL